MGSSERKKYFNVHAIISIVITWNLVVLFSGAHSEITKEPDGYPVMVIVHERRITSSSSNSSSLASPGSSSCREDNSGSAGLSGSSGLSVDDNSCYTQINPVFSNITKDTILGETGDRFKIRCISPYLTRWTSNIVLKLSASYKASKRFDHNPFDTGKKNFTNEFVLVIDYGTSGTIRCEKIDNSSIATEIYIFANSGSKLVGFVSPETIQDTNDTFLVPCRANYQGENVTLHEDNDGESVQVDPSRITKSYDSRYGFHVRGKGEVNEVYKCDTAERGTDKTRESEFEFKFFNADLYDQINQNKTKYEIKLSTTTGIIRQTAKKRLSGIVCESKEIKLDRLVMIRCNSPYECDWLSLCFENECTRADDEKQFELWNIHQTEYSNVLRNPYPRGIIRCSAKLEVTPTTKATIYTDQYYFTGLDRFSYFLSDPIPQTALIKLETMERFYYTNTTVDFLCEISTFLLVSNIKFAVVYRNKTRTLLEFDPTGDKSITEFKRGGYSTKKISFMPNLNMTEIVCMAPWYNSTEWINASRAFNPKDKLPPKIDKGSGNGTRIFFRDDTQQYLPCSATGEPTPEIKWEYYINETAGKENVKVGESTLGFTKIDDTIQGKYTCFAYNEFGNDSYLFDVKVEERDTSLGAGLIALISLAGIGFLALVIGLLYVGYQYNAAKDRIRDLTEEEINEFNYGILDGENVEEGGSGIARAGAFNKAYVIPEEELIIVKSAVLGEGEYGVVYRGFLQDDAVAVKTTKPNPDVSYFKALLMELKIMAYIGKHPNVIAFRGAVVNRIRERVVYAVVELSPLGNLHAYLRKIGPDFYNLVKDTELTITGTNYANVIEKKISTYNLINWCKQIADGMDYLATKKVIHGDLAARNILVFKNDVVKITDFGLSRQMYGYANYVKKQKVALPWRWMAIESLRFMEFSTHSDVWAFGITVWEIFSMAEVPYPGFSWTADFVDKLSTGLRMNRPKFAPQTIYNQLVKCWSPSTADRPSFKELSEFFLDVLKHTDFIMENAFREDIQNDNTSPEYQNLVLQKKNSAGEYLSA